MIDDEGTQVVAARLPFGWPADSGVTADIIEAAMELAIDTARHATARLALRCLMLRHSEHSRVATPILNRGIASLTPKPTFYGPQ